MFNVKCVSNMYFVNISKYSIMCVVVLANKT